MAVVPDQVQPTIQHERSWCFIQGISNHLKLDSLLLCDSTVIHSHKINQKLSSLSVVSALEEGMQIGFYLLPPHRVQLGAVVGTIWFILSLVVRSWWISLKLKVFTSGENPFNLVKENPWDQSY